ncbi:sporulation histidine kinase inhibitor Sda [Alkalihalobacillus sp. MEB130]|nr:sporulation histidine kinase inhibitor Sda [Alkalihalobacillus sp. MEB130]MDT8860237.1 sporulation histidine kinase inhibitor Sda [Alkalihalobacillus sp. MEB130]
MHQLNDRLLIETYEKAKNLNLNKDFIEMLEDEVKKRQLLDKIWAETKG